MKKVIIILLTGYQAIISPLLHQLLGMKTLCRYSFSCSAYAKQVILTEGVLRGGKKAVGRLLSCHPFTHNYEPV